MGTAYRVSSRVHAAIACGEQQTPQDHPRHSTCTPSQPLGFHRLPLGYPLHHLPERYFFTLWLTIHVTITYTNTIHVVFSPRTLLIKHIREDKRWRIKVLKMYVERGGGGRRVEGMSMYSTCAEEEMQVVTWILIGCKGLISSTYSVFFTLIPFHAIYLAAAVRNNTGWA